MAATTCCTAACDGPTQTVWAAGLGNSRLGGEERKGAASGEIWIYTQFPKEVRGGAQPCRASPNPPSTAADPPEGLPLPCSPLQHPCHRRRCRRLLCLPERAATITNQSAGHPAAKVACMQSHMCAIKPAEIGIPAPLISFEPLR